MSPERVCIVAEGLTDHIVFKSFLPAATETITEKNIISIQPNTDRTSSELGENMEGGWRQVFSWCLSNPPILRRQIFANGGLFEKSDPFRNSSEALIIHLDADLCDKQEFQKQADIDICNYDLTVPAERGRYIKDVLKKWLWPEGIDANDQNWTILAPAVENIETWLIVGLSNLDDPEKLLETEEFLFGVCDSNKNIRTQPNQRRIPKKKEQYRKIADEAKENIQRVIERCPHFADLIDGIKKL